MRHSPQFPGFCRTKASNLPRPRQRSIRTAVNRTEAIVRRRRSRSKGIVAFTSASPCCLDGGDVDFLHRHHRLEGAPGLTATGRKRLGERARGDLPGEAPAVLAPPALTFLAAIADDRVPVAVRLFLSVRRDLE